MPNLNAEQARKASLSKIGKLTRAIGRSATKLNETIHQVAVMCMEHALAHGDTNQCAALIDAMPKSHRRSLVIGWFAEYSPISISKNAKTDLMKAHLKGVQHERIWQIEQAKDNPFFSMPDAKKEPNIPTYEDIKNNVYSFLKAQSKKIDLIENEVDKERAVADLAKLREAIAA